MRRQVLAMRIGDLEHETERAFLQSGKWFPKSAITESFTDDQGNFVLVFKAWFVHKNRWLAYDPIGTKSTRGVRQNGHLVYQGDRRKLG